MDDVAVVVESIIRDHWEDIMWKKLEEKGIDPQLVCFCVHYDSEEYDIEGEVDF